MQSLPEIGPKKTLKFPNGETKEEMEYLLALMSPTLAMILQRSCKQDLLMNCSVDSWERVSQCFKTLLECTEDNQRANLSMLASGKEIMEDFETIIYYQILRLYEIYKTDLLSSYQVSPENIVHLTECGVSFKCDVYKKYCYNEKYVSLLPASAFYKCFINKIDINLMKHWFTARENDEIELVCIFNCFKEAPISCTELLLALSVYAPVSIRDKVNLKLKECFK